MSKKLVVLDTHTYDSGLWVGSSHPRAQPLTNLGLPAFLIHTKAPLHIGSHGLGPELLQTLKFPTLSHLGSKNLSLQAPLSFTLVGSMGPPCFLKNP